MFEMNWVLIVVLACVTHLFVVAEPIILIKRFMGFKEEEIGKNKVRDFFTKMLYCNLCSGFWIGLLFTLNPLEAVMISVIAEIIHKILR